MVHTNTLLVAAATCLGLSSALLPGPQVQKPGWKRSTQVTKRQLPAEPAGVQTLTSPGGVNITYKNPGQQGVCETTPGVNSYAGFVNLAPDVHSFVSAQRYHCDSRLLTAISSTSSKAETTLQVTLSLCG